jgi:hypothetical protein
VDCHETLERDRSINCMANSFAVAGTTISVQQNVNGSHDQAIAQDEGLRHVSRSFHLSVLPRLSFWGERPYSCRPLGCGSVREPWYCRKLCGGSS